jgi:hypothetical protein
LPTPPLSAPTTITTGFAIIVPSKLPINGAIGTSECLLWAIKWQKQGESVR